VKMSVEVAVPPKVVISTELLAQLISPESVVDLLREGQLEAGQKRKTAGNKKRAAPEGATDADVAAARDELAGAVNSFEELIQGASK
jgi:hypothetical protein